MNSYFKCKCDGPVKPVSPGIVEHACANKYAPATSYYDGIQRFVTYERVQVNPQLTNGNTRFNWFVRYS